MKYELQDNFDNLAEFAPSPQPQLNWGQDRAPQVWTSLPAWNGGFFRHDLPQDFGFRMMHDSTSRDTNDQEDNQTASRYDPSEIEDEEEGSTSLVQSEDTMDTAMQEPGVQLIDSLDDEERERLHFRKYLKGDIAKLDGVGGFDAAPEEQRKKRNQKKDPSVLVHMEASSRAVRTLEQVTDLNLNFVRWRDVFDEPSIDGSEVSHLITAYISNNSSY